MDQIISVKVIPHFLIMAFFSITFLQSAWDKAFNWKDNLSFLKTHFKNTPFSKNTSFFLGTLTVVEFISGFACSYALLRLFIYPTLKPVICALSICGLNLLMLLIGQRLAKDYVGATALGSYLLLVLAGFLFIN